MKKAKMIRTIIIVILLLTCLVFIILKVNNYLKRNDEKINLVLNNLSDTKKITIEDTLSLNKKIYEIEDEEEITKITNILKNISPTTEDTSDSSRYIIKLYNANDNEYASLTFYPIKIKGYNGKLTLKESTTDLYEILVNDYSVKFPEIDNQAQEILNKVTKIEVRSYTDNKLIKTITDLDTITQINNIIMDSKVDESKEINAIGLKYTLIFLNDNKEELATVKYDPYLLLNIGENGYKLIKFNQELTNYIER